MRAWLLALAMIATPAVAETDLLEQLYGKSSKIQTSVAVEAPDPETAANEPVELQLIESCTIQRERIYVQDLVGCSGSDDVCRAIAVAELGLAPKPGRQEKWAREKIAALIAAEFPHQAIKWSGASVSVVNAAAVSVPEDAIRLVLEKELAKIGGSTRLRIQSIRLPSLLQLRHSAYDFALPQFDNDIQAVLQNPRRRYAQFRVVAKDTHLDSPSNYEMNIAVTFYAEVLGVVSKANLQRSQTITANDVEEKWVPFQEQVFTRASDLVGKIVRSKLTQGQAVRIWDVTAEPDVHRGEKVEALLIGNGVKLNGMAEALENGAIGQKIRVRLEATKRNVVGTVVARSQVEVPMR